MEISVVVSACMELDRFTPTGYGGFSNKSLQGFATIKCAEFR